MQRGPRETHGERGKEKSVVSDGEAGHFKEGETNSVTCCRDQTIFGYKILDLATLRSLVPLVAAILNRIEGDWQV